MMAEFILACKVYLLSLPVVPGIVPGAKIKVVSKTDKYPCPQEAEFHVCETDNKNNQIIVYISF